MYDLVEIIPHVYFKEGVLGRCACALDCVCVFSEKRNQL